MEDVELVEAPGAGAPRDPAAAGTPDAVDRRREGLLRVLRRWWPVPVVTVAALVAWQVVSDARDRDRAERARGVAGVLTETVVPPLEAVRWGDDETVQVLYGGAAAAGGLLVGPVYLGDGSVPVLAADHATGAERWRTQVARTPDGSLVGAGVSCRQPAADDPPTVWCTVSEPATLADGTTGTRARAVELDVADGAVLSDRDVGTGGATAAVGDVVVLASGGPESVRVTGVDRRSGATRWDATLPERAQEGSAPAVWAAGDHVMVWGSRDVWALDPDDGRVQVHDAGVEVGTGGRLVATDHQGVSRLLDADGNPTGVSAPGEPLSLLPDDGSAAGLVLLGDDDGASTRTVRAVDPDTGDVVWEREVDRGSAANVMLLDGVLYGSGAESVWAVDAVTGEERWTTGAGSSPAWQVLTDGRVLLRTEQGTDGPELAAYALRDGDEVWRTGLPPTVENVWQTQGLLVGDGSEGLVALR